MFNWDDNPDLNITPLVDVMLVLMAILMVTAPTINFEEQITLPQGSHSKKLDNIKTLTIRIDKNRIVYFGKEKYQLNKFADFFVLKSNNFSASYCIPFDFHIIKSAFGKSLFIKNRLIFPNMPSFL